MYYRLIFHTEQVNCNELCFYLWFVFTVPVTIESLRVVQLFLMCLMALSIIWALLHLWLLFTPAGTVEDWSWYPGNSAARRSSNALNRSLRSRSHLLNWAAEATLKRIHTFKPVALILHKFFNLNWKAVEYYVADRTYSRRPCEEPAPRRTTLDDAMASTLEYIQIQFHHFLGKHWRFLKFFTIFMFLQFFFTFLCFCSRAQIPLLFKINETSQH